MENKLRVIKGADILNNSMDILPNYNDNCLIFDTSGGLYLGNSTNNPLLISDKALGTYLPLSGGTLTGNLQVDGTSTLSNILPVSDSNYNFGSYEKRYSSGWFRTLVSSSGITNEIDKNHLSLGLKVHTNIIADGNGYVSDFGFPTTNNANGVLSFRTVTAPASNPHYYLHQLGFSGNGDLYYRCLTHGNNTWSNLIYPSLLKISSPVLNEYSSSPKLLPEILNDNICNIFHDIPQTQILIERSQDGTTWTDTTETDYPKFKQVMSSGKGAEVPVVAYDGASGQVGDRVRITINGAAAYARLSHLYVYYSTMGNTTKLTVEKNSYGDQNTWTALIDKQTCTGWSGPNYYGLNNSYFGRIGGNEGYSYRLTFEITAITSGQTNIGYLNNIWAFSSDRPWSKPSNHTEMFYFNTNRWKFVTNKSIEPLYDVTYSLGSSNYRWSSIYAKDFYGTNFYGTAQKATQDGSGNTITSTYAKLASNNVFTAQQKVVYNGRATLIKNGSIGFIDPNTSSWAYATSMFDTTGENTLANICGAKGGNNTVQYVYMGGTFDKPWLKVTPTGALTSPFISKISGNILASWTRNLCNHTAIYGSSQTHNSCVIKTGIPVSTGKLYQMHVYGYNYHAGGQVDFTIGFYMYNGTPFKVYGVSNGTLTNPHYYIGKYTENEVEKVCVYWTCDDSTGNNQQHYIMVDALDNSNTWSIEEYTTEVAATITSMTEALLHERMTLNKAETVTGNKTFTGAFNANTNLNIGSGYGINFNRNDYNYINIPSGDYSALAISKGGMSGANTLYVMDGSALFPYNNNNNDLGTPAKTWKDVYAAKFITTDGTSSQFVKGDGSLDSNVYATTEQLIEVEKVTATALLNLENNKANKVDFNNYLLLSGGTMTGHIDGVTNLTADTIISNGTGFRFSNDSSPGYIWNNKISGEIAIGVKDNGDESLSNASIIINGINVYPGKSNNFNLGTLTEQWNSIYSKTFYENGKSLNDKYLLLTGGTLSGNVIAPAFVTTNGTVNQFVKGDGSLDSNVYVTKEQLIEVEEVIAESLIELESNKADASLLDLYFAKTGGNISGNITIEGNTNIKNIIPTINNTFDIGETNNRFKDAYFSGNVYAANGFYESSDERLKDFGEGLKVNLDELSKLRKSYFTFKDKPEDLQIGISAQEIQKLYPEIVSETDNGYLNVDYSKLAVIALAAIDKLNERVKKLEKINSDILEKLSNI